MWTSSAKLACAAGGGGVCVFTWEEKAASADGTAIPLQNEPLPLYLSRMKKRDVACIALPLRSTSLSQHPMTMLLSHTPQPLQTVSIPQFPHHLPYGRCQIR